MQHYFDVQKKRKEILVYEGKRKKTDKLCKLIKELCHNSTIYRSSDIEEAYHIVFSKRIELIFVRIDMESCHGDLEIRFIEDIKSCKKLSFIPIIVISTKELNILHFLGELHCYGVLETQFCPDYAKKMIQDALYYEHRFHETEFAYFKMKHAIKCVHISEILFIEHRKNLTVVHTMTEQFAVARCSTLQTLEKFGAHDFIQCAKGVVVNMKRISRIERKTKRIFFANQHAWVEFGKNYYKDISAYMKRGVC